MRLDSFVLILVIIAAIIVGASWIGFYVFLLPLGFLILIPGAIVLGLLAMVIYQRVTNREDDYYDKNVDQ